jgi:Outer membrane protein Omp28
MKKYLNLLVVTFLLIGCDQIEQPYSNIKYRYKEEKYGPAPTFSLLNNPLKNVLVEEFTGHLCGFCPASTKLVNELDSILGERMVTISIHAGTLAAVSAPPFDADYNTTPGNLYWSQLNGGFNPCARIDRLGGISNFTWLDADNPDSWRDIIQSQKNLTPKAAIQLQADFVTEDNVINIHTATQFQTNLSGNYQLVVLVVESDIVSPQVDYDQTPPEVEDYHHKHVLRASVTEAMGNTIAANPSANEIKTTSYTFPLKSGWVGNHCTVVAYLIDPNSQEIINAAEYELE